MTYLCVGHKRVIRAEGLQTNFKDLLMHLQGLRVLRLLLIHNGNIVFGAGRKRVVAAERDIKHCERLVVGAKGLFILTH